MTTKGYYHRLIDEEGIFPIDVSRLISEYLPHPEGSAKPPARQRSKDIDKLIPILFRLLSLARIEELK